MKQREKGISVIVGQMYDANGECIPLYRAERSLACSSCGAKISAGELFTRRALTGPALRLSAECQKCAPFSSDTERASEMIRALLSSDNESSSAEPTAQPARRKTIAEEVERRLGPALKYRRRKQNS
jgi:hypothetical protein